MPDSDLFIATEEEARTGGVNVPPPIYDREPEPTDESLPFGSMSPLELESLWLILRGIPLATSQEADLIDHFALVYEGQEEDVWVCAIPQDLQDRLAAMDEAYVASASLLWATTEEMRPDKRFHRWTWEGIRDELALMVTLAKLGKQAGKNLYLRISL